MYFALWTIIGIVFLVAVFKKEVIGKGDSSYVTSRRRDAVDDEAAEERRVISKLIAAHPDCDSQVLQACISGRRRVDAFSLTRVGDRVDLRMVRGELRLYAYGEFVTDLYARYESPFDRALAANRPFEAYLKSRSTFFTSDDCTVCDIIVFFKTV